MHGLFLTFIFPGKVEWVSMPAVIHWPASHSHLGAVQFCWTALTVWTEQLQSAGCGAAALGFIVEVVEGWLEGGKERLLIHFPSADLPVRSHRLFPVGCRCPIIIAWQMGQRNIFRSSVAHHHSYQCCTCCTGAQFSWTNYAFQTN